MIMVCFYYSSVFLKLSAETEWVLVIPQKLEEGLG